MLDYTAVEGSYAEADRKIKFVFAVTMIPISMAVLFCCAVAFKSVFRHTDFTRRMKENCDDMETSIDKFD